MQFCKYAFLNSHVTFYRLRQNYTRNIHGETLTKHIEFILMEPAKEFVVRVFLSYADFSFIWKGFSWLRNRIFRQAVLVKITIALRFQKKIRKKKLLLLHVTEHFFYLCVFLQRFRTVCDSVHKMK